MKIRKKKKQKRKRKRRRRRRRRRIKERMEGETRQRILKREDFTSQWIRRFTACAPAYRVLTITA